MPDFIDRLKEQDRNKANEDNTKEQLRLHNAKVIGAKAPAFWSDVVTQINKYAERLRQEFPDNRARHCSVVPQGNGIQVQGAKLPWRILLLELKVDGQFVDIVEKEKLNISTEAPSGRDEIKITVVDGEDLAFMFKRNAYYDPASLAEAIIMYVCKMTAAPR